MEKLEEKIKSMSFEKALAELETITEQLEMGSVPLEESISLYERSIVLHRHCEKLLKSAESRIEKISLSETGHKTEPLTFEPTNPDASPTHVEGKEKF